MIPLYGFLQGDTIGLLILADEGDTMAVLADKLQSAASVRVPLRHDVQVVVGGAAIPPGRTVGGVELRALDRFDVVEGGERRDTAQGL